LTIRNFAAPGLGAERLYIERKRDSAMQNLNLTTPPRAAGQMEVHELMELVIPRGEAERIAGLMGYTVDYVRRWRRPRETDDERDSARRDPVTNLLILFDALRARKLQHMIPLIMDYINSDLAGGSEVEGQPSAITAAEAESELRAAATRFTKIADMLAAKNGRQ
jgi:hypothetical protein